MKSRGAAVHSQDFSQMFQTLRGNFFLHCLDAGRSPPPRSGMLPGGARGRPVKNHRSRSTRRRQDTASLLRRKRAWQISRRKIDSPWEESSPKIHVSTE